MLIKYFFSKKSHSIYSILRGKIRNVFHCDDTGKIDDFVSDIYLWSFQPVLKRLVSNTVHQLLVEYGISALNRLKLKRVVTPLKCSDEYFLLMLRGGNKAYNQCSIRKIRNIFVHDVTEYVVKAIADRKDEMMKDLDDF